MLWWNKILTSLVRVVQQWCKTFDISRGFDILYFDIFWIIFLICNISVTDWLTWVTGIKHFYLEMKLKLRTSQTILIFWGQENMSTHAYLNTYDIMMVWNSQVFGVPAMIRNFWNIYEIRYHLNYFLHL